MFDTFSVADLALDLNPGSQYYEDSVAEVMAPFRSRAAEKWQKENCKLAALVHGNFRHVEI